MPERPLQVLVVDDTVVYRRVLQNVVAEISGAEVVGIAANGRIALDKLEQLDVDIVLLDVEMPELDGISTLREIRARWPGIGVVLLSGADRRSADLTMTALELGAIDFVAKADTGDLQRNQRQLVSQLSAIMRGFEVARNLRGDRVSARAKGSLPPALPSLPARNQAKEGAGKVDLPGEARNDKRSASALDASVGARSSAAWRSAQPVGPSFPTSRVSLRPSKQVAEVLLIGCSTGGPQALAKIIPLLPSELGVPVLVVQHMPPVFTASLAEILNRTSKLTVVEAVEHQILVPNTVYIAPGGRHMTIKGDRGKGEKRISLNDDPPVNSVRPSVDVLFQSAAHAFGGQTLAVILTGMGEDGLGGARALRNAGGQILTQNAASCVVYGMPRAIEQAGLSDESVHVDELAGRIVQLIRHAPGTKAAPSRSHST